MNPRNDAGELYAQGLIDVDEWYRLDQIRVKEVNNRARAWAWSHPTTQGWEFYGGRGQAYDSSNANLNPNNLPEKKDLHE